MHAPTRQRLTLQIEELRTTLSRVEEERDGALQRLEEQQQQPPQPPNEQTAPSPSGVAELAGLEEEDERSGDGIPQEEAQEQEKEGKSDLEKRALVAERCVGSIDATVP